MPGFDRTGPMGQGPHTGRGLGYCNPVYDTQYAPAYSYGYGRGRGFGRGPGRGFGRGMRGRFQMPFMSSYQQSYAPMPLPPAPLTKDQELSMLKEDLTNLEREKEALAKRIEALEKE